jgi:flagellar basal-body rod protein FlgG
MDVQQARVDTLTNNLANTDTPGFQQDQVSITSFPDYLSVIRLDGSNSAALGTAAFGPLVAGSTTDTAPGPLKKTGVATDLALSGDGFFTVAGTGGQRLYTRDGSFTVDPGGYLATATGQQVLGTSGPIPVDGTGFTVNAQGQVKVGNNTYNLALTSFSQPGLLRKAGNNLYTAPTAAGAGPAAGTTVTQGYLEGSNVDLIKEMVDIIDAERTFESLQKVIQAQDGVMKQSAQLGNPS